MIMNPINFSCLFLFVLLFRTVDYVTCENTDKKIRKDKHFDDSDAILIESCHDDMACLIRASEDKLGLEAIRALHRQLDDDANGAIDLSESNDFLREELKYENGAERRQKAFHRNDDMYISVKELWEAWVKSEVHNWTVEQTAEWLTTNVELKQYVPSFIFNRVTGAHLPRLAAGNGQYLTNVLGIKDPIHKQKIMLKAMDVVLFGPPKDNINYAKDLVLITLLISALTGCYYAYRQGRSSTRHLQRMMKDMEGLQKAELDLKNLQKELERAKQEQEYVTTEKQNLEKQLKEQSADGSDIHNSSCCLETSQLKAEIEVLRNALQRAEGELVDRYWSPPHGLQLWLQLTHEIENKSYGMKKASAERQLQVARDACEKLRKKRSSLVGAFVSTHGRSIDDVDRSIVDARTALNEVTQELAERVHRWKQIETLCGFSIINNKGLNYLESVLYRNSVNGRNLGFRGRMNSSQDNVDDDTVSNYSVPTGISFTERGVESYSNQWAENQETSDSEKLEHDDDDESVHSSVQFTLGAEPEDRKHAVQVAHLSKDIKNGLGTAKPSRSIVRSATEDHSHSFESETQQSSDAIAQKLRRPPRRSKLAATADDESAGSTDSNSTAVEDTTSMTSVDGAISKKSKLKRKLFPKFSRKSKTVDG